MNGETRLAVEQFNGIFVANPTVANWNQVIAEWVGA